MNTLPLRYAAAEGAGRTEQGDETASKLSRRQRVERDIHATLNHIERLARVGQNPGFPAEFEHRLRTVVKPFSASQSSLPMDTLRNTHKSFEHLAREASSVKMLEGVG